MSATGLVRGVGAAFGVGLVMLASIVMSMGTAYAAGIPAGCTAIQSGTGTVCVDFKSRSNTDVESFGGSFLSGTKVVRPKLVVTLSDVNNKVVMTAQQEWGNDRVSESVTRAGKSFEFPLNRVCATLYEAGEKLGMACTVIPTSS